MVSWDWLVTCFGKTEQEEWDESAYTAGPTYYIIENRPCGVNLTPTI